MAFIPGDFLLSKASMAREIHATESSPQMAGIQRLRGCVQRVEFLSPLVKDTTKLGKKKKMLTPATFSLIHATDFADRTEKSILPLLKAGAVVLCDRYAYTAFARDVAGAWTANGFASSTISP